MFHGLIALEGWTTAGEGVWKLSQERGDRLVLYSHRTYLGSPEDVHWVAQEWEQLMLWGSVGTPRFREEDDKEYARYEPEWESQFCRMIARCLSENGHRAALSVP